MVKLIETFPGEFLSYSKPVLVRCKNCKSDLVLFKRCKKYGKDRKYWRVRACDFFYEVYNLKLDKVECSSCDAQLGKEDNENAEDEEWTFFLIKRCLLELYYIEPF